MLEDWEVSTEETEENLRDYEQDSLEYSDYHYADHYDQYEINSSSNSYSSFNEGTDQHRATTLSTPYPHTPYPHHSRNRHSTPLFYRR